jgi:hypothetical protein
VWLKYNLHERLQDLPCEDLDVGATNTADLVREFERTHSESCNDLYDVAIDRQSAQSFEIRVDHQLTNSLSIARLIQ